jgi:hypothetical protein
MPNTTNFNFPTPADTDLVKDGALAIRDLGNSIDTAFVDLKGGTTGQFLSKNSNTDLDFVFATPASGLTLISTTTIGTAVSTVSLNDVFTSTYTNYKVIIEWVGSSASTNVNLRLRASGSDNSTANSYQPRGFSNIGASVASFGSAGAQIQLGTIINNDREFTSMEIFRPQLAVITGFLVNHFEYSNNSTFQFMGVHNQTTSYDGFTVFPTTGTLTNGTIYVYGYGK